MTNKNPNRPPARPPEPGPRARPAVRPDGEAPAFLQQIRQRLAPLRPPAPPAPPSWPLDELDELDGAESELPDLVGGRDDDDEDDEDERTVLLQDRSLLEQVRGTLQGQPAVAPADELDDHGPEDATAAIDAHLLAAALDGQGLRPAGPDVDSLTGDLDELFEDDIDTPRPPAAMDEAAWSGEQQAWPAAVDEAAWADEQQAFDEADEYALSDEPDERTLVGSEERLSAGTEASGGAYPDPDVDESEAAGEAEGYVYAEGYAYAEDEAYAEGYAYAEDEAYAEEAEEGGGAERYAQAGLHEEDDAYTQEDAEDYVPLRLDEPEEPADEAYSDESESPAWYGTALHPQEAVEEAEEEVPFEQRLEAYLADEEVQAPVAKTWYDEEPPAEQDVEVENFAERLEARLADTAAEPDRPSCAHCGEPLEGLLAQRLLELTEALQSLRSEVHELARRLPS
jgi:hypothetical protein